MAQFDVYLIEGYGLVVDCQSDLLSELRSRLVAPLRDPAEPIVFSTRLNPVVEVEKRTYRVAAQFLRAVDREQLGTRVATLAGSEFEIKTAIDMVVSGF